MKLCMSCIDVASPSACTCLNMCNPSDAHVVIRGDTQGANSFENFV